MKPTNHSWRFFRAGGSNQAIIKSGKDIENIGRLDAKLWSALSCPTSGLTLDSKTLELLDINGDARIRRSEIIAACQWTCKNLKDSDMLAKGAEALPLANINSDDPEGKILLESAREILANLGKPDAAEISVADFADESKIFAATPFNADGVITGLSCQNDAETDAFKTILSVSEPKKDRSGADGIDAADIEKFFADSAAYLAWKNQPQADGAIFCMGADTAAAFAAYAALEQEIDEWFARAEIIGYQPDIQAAIAAQADEKLVGAYADLNFAHLKTLPLAKVNTTEIIDFSVGVNPAWLAEARAFVENVLKPLTSKTVLDKTQWGEIKAKFAPYKNWLSSKPETKIEGIDAAKLAELCGGSAKQDLLALIEKDGELKQKVENFASVEKLARFNRDLATLLRNFISFQDFYAKNKKAIFQYGNLFIDGRMCELCIKVDNVADHMKMASLGYGYLLYCTCTRKGSAPINIVAMVTSGDSDNLIVGRNGIFYDYLGNEWDANITKIVDNPIGLYQAFFSPYKRLVRWVSEQISKRAAEADKAAVSNVTDGKVVNGKEKKIDIGTVAALGVAVGGITTAFGMVLEAVFGLGYWLPLGLAGIILAISLPSVFLAYLKLRMRNLAPLLDGNGWAVNSKAAISMTFGEHLTRMARLPKGAGLTTVSGSEKRGGGLKFVAIALIAAAAIAGLCYHKGCFSKQQKAQQPQTQQAKPAKAQQAKSVKPAAEKTQQAKSVTPAAAPQAKAAQPAQTQPAQQAQQVKSVLQAQPAQAPQANPAPAPQAK